MGQPGYQYNLSDEELKESVGASPNFSDAMAEKIIEESKGYRDKQKKNIFSKSREDQKVQEQVEEIEGQLSDKEMDDEETQLISNEPSVTE